MLGIQGALLQAGGGNSFKQVQGFLGVALVACFPAQGAVVPLQRYGGITGFDPGVAVHGRKPPNVKARICTGGPLCLKRISPGNTGPFATFENTSLQPKAAAAREDSYTRQAAMIGWGNVIL